MSKLNKIFEIVSFYDNARWNSEENYNLINFYKEGLDDDTKLLTHWLCYITDRQMGFERIFDIGGFVFSELISEYKKKPPIRELLNPSEYNSFVKKEFDKKENKYKHFFIGTKLPNTKIIKNYPAEVKDAPVKFKPRFLPSDYLSILYTLHTLEKFDYSLSNYIAQAYKTFKDEEDLIQRVLFALYLLSYYEIGQPRYENITEWETNIKNAENRRDIICQYFEEPESKEDEFKTFQKNTRFHLKRAWCSLRDFLKSPKFSQYFKNSMLKNKYLNEKELENLFGIEMLCQLELPGDVWNNNPKFQKCIRDDEKFDNSKFNQFLREHYNSNESNLKYGKAYPEQFDITFDFVPRMCDKNNCDICPIGCLSGEGKDFDKICLNDTSKYCPVVLVGCGYKKICVGSEKCELLQILK